MSHLQDLVLAILKQHPDGLTAYQIHPLLGSYSCGFRTLQQALIRLHTAGLIWRGKERGQRAVIWGII